MKRRSFFGVAVAVIAGLFLPNKPQTRFKSVYELVRATSDDQELIDYFAKKEIASAPVDGSVTRSDGTNYRWYFHPGAKGIAPWL